jgi:hypothetical protein
MKKSKVIGVIKAVSDVAQSKDPGKTAGKLVRTAVTVSHPIVGTIAGPAIEKGTEKAVNKVIEVSKDPEVRAKAKELGTKAADATTRAGRLLVEGGKRKLGEFRSQIGR